MSRQEVIEKLSLALAAAQNGDWAEVIIVAEGKDGAGWVGFTGNKLRAIGLLGAADAVIRAGVVSDSRAVTPETVPTLSSGGGVKVN